MTKAPDCFAAAYRENNPGEAMPGVFLPPFYRFAGVTRRTNGEAGEAITRPVSPCLLGNRLKQWRG